MARFDEWLDRKLEQLCSALAINVAPQGAVARFGFAFAGVNSEPHLPSARRWSENRHDHHHTHRDAPPSGGKWNGIGASPNAGPAGGTDDRGTPMDTSDASAGGICAQPQYCWIYGRPCACCGGSDSSCPSGTNKGWYWPYTCSGRMRWFSDCCNSGTTTCPSDCPFCKNASAQPSWCGSAGPHYVCTLSEDKGASGSSTPGS